MVNGFAAGLSPCASLGVVAAVQDFSSFDSAGAGDAEHIDEKLSTSCARWAAACMRAMRSKRARSAMLHLLPLSCIRLYVVDLTLTLTLPLLLYGR